MFLKAKAKKQIKERQSLCNEFGKQRFFRGIKNDKIDFNCLQTSNELHFPLRTQTKTTPNASGAEASQNFEVQSFFVCCLASGSF